MSGRIVGKPYKWNIEIAQKLHLDVSPLVTLASHIIDSHAVEIGAIAT
jgi:hypothetical protein